MCMCDMCVWLHGLCEYVKCICMMCMFVCPFMSVYSVCTSQEGGPDSQRCCHCLAFLHQQSWDQVTLCQVHFLHRTEV